MTTSTMQMDTTQPVSNEKVSNERVAERLDSIAEMLDAENANPFRVQAYRNAAETLRQLTQPVHEMLAAEGVEALRRLPGIGQSLADSIAQLVQADDLPLLQRLRSETSATRVLASVSGIGTQLAGRIYDQLAIQSLHDLLTAAYDGRLSQVPGFGPRRVRAIRETLTGRLHRSHSTLRPTRRQSTNQPTVAELLDVDREYREQAKTGQLRYLTPRRFNPTGAAWLPVLYTERANVRYTALYSNTARAHELEMTHDWVVIYRDDPNGAGPWTVISAFYGTLRGKRVVRGREKECEVYYASRA